MTNYIERANVLIEQRRYQLAEEELYKALADSPDSATAQHLLAFCLYNQQRYTEALPVISAAIALQPDGAGHHFYHGQILRRLNRSEEAAAANITTLRLNPQDPDAHAQAAAIAMYDQQDYTAAIDHADRALQLDATHAWSLELRLLALYELDQLSTVAADARAALALLPTYADFHTIAGMVAARRQQVPEALAAFREALRLQPDNAWATHRFLEALQPMADRAMADRRFEDAADHYREARLLDPDSDWGRSGLITALKARSQLKLGPISLGSNALISTWQLSRDPEGQQLLSHDEISGNRFTICFFSAAILGIVILLLTHQLSWGLLPLPIGLILFCLHHWSAQKQLSDQFVSAYLILFGITGAGLCFLIGAGLPNDQQVMVLIYASLLLSSSGLLLVASLALLVKIEKSLNRTIADLRRRPMSRSELLEILRDSAISLTLIAAAGILLTLITRQVGWLFLIPVPWTVGSGRRQWHRGWRGWLKGLAAIILGLALVNLAIAFIFPFAKATQDNFGAVFMMLMLLSGLIWMVAYCLEGTVETFQRLTQLSKKAQAGRRSNKRG
jgi:tetratricopeptide (TPR) repeat protein